MNRKTALMGLMEGRYTEPLERAQYNKRLIAGVLERDLELVAVGSVEVPERLVAEAVEAAGEVAAGLRGFQRAGIAGFIVGFHAANALHKSGGCGDKPDAQAKPSALPFPDGVRHEPATLAERHAGKAEMDAEASATRKARGDVDTLKKKRHSPHRKVHERRFHGRSHERQDREDLDRDA